VGDLERIDPGRFPPGRLVAGAVELAVVHAAERDDEFIARLASERPRLRIAKMMRVGWLTAADEARHFDNGPQVRCGDRKRAFVYGRCRIAIAVFGRGRASAIIRHDPAHAMADCLFGVLRH
jgi:hypothetical protein